VVKIATFAKPQNVSGYARASIELQGTFDKNLFIVYIRYVKKKQNIGLDVIIDKLTNSIENTLTGEVFDTEIVRLTSADAKQIKKADWQFDWRKELKDTTKEVYKLTTVNNPTIIQGLVSIEDKQDHVFMHLIESAKFNKGKSKVYVGVPGNLVAYVCKVSVDKGFEGFLAFDAKSALIKHYQELLHATHFRGLRDCLKTHFLAKRRRSSRIIAISTNA
jgi:hypothetical protein